jgi:hypothetical protein
MSNTVANARPADRPLKRSCPENQTDDPEWKRLPVPDRRAILILESTANKLGAIAKFGSSYFDCSVLRNLNLIEASGASALRERKISPACSKIPPSYQGYLKSAPLFDPPAVTLVII